MELDAAARIHTSSFAQAVACPEVQPYLVHLGLPGDVTQRLPRLASNFLTSAGELLPCLEAGQGDKFTTLSSQELHELEALADVHLPPHRDRSQKFLWLSEVFIPVEKVTATQPLPLPENKATKLRGLLTAFDAVLDPIDGALEGLEARWLRAYGLEDRRPYSTLYESISWRYYKDLWRKIKDLLSLDELRDFVQWARSVSTHDRKYGELEPPPAML
jgi:hypothetical protein